MRQGSGQHHDATDTIRENARNPSADKENRSAAVRW
jgi:hypothetical protein